MNGIRSLSLRRKIIAGALLFLMVINMSAIFFFSSEDASASSEQSGQISDVVVDVGEQIHRPGDKPPMIKEEKQNWKSQIDYVVRELAHFLEFLPLGLLGCALLLTVKAKAWLSAALSAAWGLLYAVSDEIHQLYVPGRSCSFQDIAIDFLGVACGVLMTLVVALVILPWIIRRRKRICN